MHACVMLHAVIEWSLRRAWIQGVTSTAVDVQCVYVYMCIMQSNFVSRRPVHPRQGLDKNVDPVFQDLTSDTGFAKALQVLLRVVVGGLLFGGVPCNSFGFMSQGGHQRSALQPWGREEFMFVEEGSVLASRFAIMCLIACCRGVTWFLENPGRSTISMIPPLQLLLRPELRPLTVRWSDPHAVPMHMIAQCNMLSASGKHVCTQLCMCPHLI